MASSCRPPPETACCTANTDIDESDVPKDSCRTTISRLWGATWINTWQFGDGLQLKSITAYRDMEACSVATATTRRSTTAATSTTRTQEQFSQELQLASQGNERSTGSWALLPARETRDQTRLVTADGLFDALTALAPFIDFNNPAEPLLWLYALRYALELTVDFDNHQTTRTTRRTRTATGRSPTVGTRARLALHERGEGVPQMATRVASQTPLLIAIDPSRASRSVGANSRTSGDTEPGAART